MQYLGDITNVDSRVDDEQATYLYKPQSFVDLINWNEIFTVDRPVEIDIGCGKGRFLAWVAQNNQLTNFLGVDRQLNRLRKVEKKLNGLYLSNVRLIRIEASYLVGKLIRNRTVAAYHSYFSDPWPKRRHHRRRLFTRKYMSDIYRTLENNGMLHVATDHEGYFKVISKLVSEMPTFVKSNRAYLPIGAQTEFERDFIAENKPIYRQSWRKSQELEV